MGRGVRGRKEREKREEKVVEKDGGRTFFLLEAREAAGIRSSGHSASVRTLSSQSGGSDEEEERRQSDSPS